MISRSEEKFRPCSLQKGVCDPNLMDKFIDFIVLDELMRGLGTLCPFIKPLQMTFLSAVMG